MHDLGAGCNTGKRDHSVVRMDDHVVGEGHAYGDARANAEEAFGLLGGPIYADDFSLEPARRVSDTISC